MPVSNGMRRARLCLVGALFAGLVSATVVVLPVAATVPNPPAPVNPTPAFSAVTTPGPTQVTGNLTVDTVWGPAGSPYVVDQLTVTAGTSLTVLPGTVVKFKNQASYLNALGQLLVLGTPADRAVFTSLKDDSVGGDTNGDGSATSPGRGDWTRIGILSNSAPSLIDHADIRFGGYASNPACTLSAAVKVQVSDAMFVLSNSSVTDSLSSGFGAAPVDSDAFTGVYDNTFARSDCGVAVISAGGDYVGNSFDDSFTRAAFISNTPSGARFWFNDVDDEVTVVGVGGAPTQADLDLRFNTLSGGIGTWGLSSQQKTDYSSNWWGADVNTAPPLPNCLTQAEADAYYPAINYTTGSGCTAGNVHPTGYKKAVTPSLSGPPSAIPQALLRLAAPTFGPIDTNRGSLTYTAEDMVVEDAGKALTARRTYSSATLAGDAGEGWRSAFTESLSTVPGVATLSFGDQSSVPFPIDPAAGYTPARGVAAGYSSGGTGSSVTTADKTTYNFDTAGQLQEMFLGDPGHKVDVDREDGEVSKVTGVSGRFISYDRNGDGRLNALSDSQGRDVTLAHTGDKLTSATGVDGKTETYGYSGDKLTMVTSPNGVVKLKVGYDSEDRVEWIAQQGTGRATIAYGTGTRTITLADGTKIDQSVDELGRLVREGVRGRSATHVIYDGEGRTISRISGVPATPMTGYSAVAGATFYDRKGDPVRQVDPMGRATVTTYNSKHDPLKVTDPNGAVTTYSYDSDDRVDQVTDPLGRDWTFDHNSRGQVTRIGDPLSRDKLFTYQGDGDLATTTDEFGGVATNETDAHGWVTATIDPLTRRTEFTHTTWGQVKSVKTPSGGTQTAVFNDDRDLTKITDPRGGETSYAYDVQGRLDKVTDAADGETTTAYDDLGRPETVTDVRGGVHTRTYSPEGWPTSLEGPGDVTTSTAYDPAGRPVWMTDELGQVTQNVLNRSGQTIKTQTPDGATRSFTYDAGGRQTKLVDGVGSSWSTTYDLVGNQLTTTDPLTKTTTREYDAVGRIKKLTNEAAVATTYVYDDTARKVTVSDPLGIVSVNYVDAAGQSTKITDGEGGSELFAYNPDGLVSERTSATGGAKTYTYNDAGDLTAQEDELGNSIVATYDVLGRLKSRTFPDESTESFDYDAAGNLTKRTDRRGKDWTFTFDAYNRVLKATDPLAGETTYTYDAAGRRTKVTDPTGIETRTAFDPAGRAAVVSDPTDASTVATYDLEGRPKTITDPAGVVTTHVYDAKGQRTSTATTGGLSTVNYTYDAVGNQLTEKTSSSQTYKREYDARNRPTAFVDALGKRTITTYDLAGHATSRTTPLGHQTTWTYDATGRLKSAEDPLGNTSSYDYDAKGQLTGLELPLGGQFDFTYDADGRVKTEKNPLNKTTAYAYDSTGNQTSRTEPSGTIISSTFDAAGRQTEQSAGSATRTFTYDAAGRMLTASSGSDSVELSYNNRGLLATSEDSLGETAYTYDAASRLASFALPTGDTSTYTYNGFGSVAGIRGPTNLNFTYKPDGALAGFSDQTGTSNATQAFSYNANDRLTSISAGSGTQFTATYTDDGQTATTTQAIAGVTNPVEGTNTNTYDAAGRLTGTALTQGATAVSSQQFEWDDDGNRTSVQSGTDPAVTTAFDDAGRITSTSDGTNYTYNDDGELTGIDRPTGDDSTYTYNSFGELTSTTQGAQTVALERDPLGRVAKRTEGSAPTEFGYSATTNTPTVVGKSGDDTALIRDPGGRLLSAKTGSTVQHVLENLHGDIAGYRNNTGAALTSTALYEPFGQATTTGTDTNLLGFQSMLDDPVTGLVDMGARNYDPTTGRFISEDTIAGDLTAPITLNRYTYGNANPLDFFDPDGHWPKWVEDKYNKYVVEPFKAIVRGVKSFVSAVAQGASRAASAAVSAASRARKTAAAAAAAVQRALPAVVSDVAGGAQSFSSGFGDSVQSLAGSVDINKVHIALDAAGLIPGIGELADGTNAAIYLIQGDTKNALISMGAMIPIAGGAVVAGRYALKRSERAVDAVVAGRVATHGDAVAMRELAERVQASHSRDWLRRNTTSAGIRAWDPSSQSTVDVVGSSLDEVDDAFLAAVRREGAEFADVPGTHAEIAALTHIRQQGWTPLAGGSSRNVCRTICEPDLRATLFGPLFPSRADKTPFRQFIWSRND